MAKYFTELDSTTNKLINLDGIRNRKSCPNQIRLQSKRQIFNI